MAQLKGIFKRIVLIIVLLSLLIGFCATPASYAKLTLEDGEFYYSGTTKGSYVASSGIFSWLNEMLAQLGTFLLNLITYGIRMVFIGWTALIEKILTWALESASGVNLEGEDISSTDLSAISDSTNNVTVQAIVYNRVPALNVNFFDTDISSIYLKDVEDEDGTVVTKAYSPTGQELICSKCGKNVTECCDSIDKTKIGEINDPKVSVTCNTSSTDDCKCNGCDACKTYAEMYNAEDPIIIQLKNLVAVWYNLIRVLALAAMLIVLLFVGIKMALSTVASDKAVYKRMLVDWIVGVAIIFLIHYFMYLAIIITETLVDTVADVGDQVHQVTMMQITDSDDTDESEISDQDLEIDMYEEIRTRAYDFNLSIGLPGMIMYMTLVFMAIKYTLIYIKRFLTLAVLTMMAPAVGVAYAIQKTLSGKSSSLKTWMTEYILNLIIQVVHALIYAVFVSAALVFSLENVSGIIVALIFLNFASDAEKIFRRIFNLDPGGKGLLGGTEGAGDIDKKIKEAKGMAVGAKPLAKMASAPARAAVSLAGKTAAGAYGLLATSGIDGKTPDEVDTSTSDEEDTNDDSSEETSQERTDNLDPESQEALDAAINGPKTKAGREKEDRELLNTDEETLKANLAEETQALDNMKGSKKEVAAQRNKVFDAKRKLARYRKLVGNEMGQLSTGELMVGHLKNISSINNNFNLVLDNKGNLVYQRKTYEERNTPYKKFEKGYAKAKSVKRAMYGYRKYNPVTGRYEKVKDGAFYNQFSSENLLGLSKEEKKLLKEQVLNPAKKGFGGMAAMFVGMGTLVTNPKIGMAALASGAGYTYNMARKFKIPKGYKYSNRRFKFGKFSTRSQINMADSVVEDANRALAASLSNEKNSFKFNRYRRAIYGPNYNNKNLRLYSPGNTALEQADRMHARNVRKQEILFREEAYRLMVEQSEIYAELKMESYTQKISDIMNKNVKTRDEELANIEKRLKVIKNPKEADKLIEELQNKLKQLPSQEKMQQTEKQLQEQMESAQRQRKESKGYDNGEDFIAMQEIHRINQEKRNLAQQKEEFENLSKQIQELKEQKAEYKELTDRKTVLEARNYGVDPKTFIEEICKSDDLNLSIIDNGLSEEEAKVLSDAIKNQQNFTEINEMYEKVKKEAEKYGITNGIEDNNEEGNSEGKQKTLEEKQDEIIAMYLAMGFVYDEKTKSFKRKGESVGEGKKKAKKTDDVDAEDTVIATKKITETDVRTINKEINNAIIKQLQGKQIDVNDEKVLGQIMKDLSSSLAKQGILGVGQNADILFKQGNNGLKSRIKDNATKVNNEVITKQTNLKVEQVDVIKQTIKEVANETAKNGKEVDMSKLDQGEILNRVASKLNIQVPKSQQDTQQEPGQDQSKPKGKQNINKDIENISNDQEIKNIKNAISSMVGTESKTVELSKIESAMISNMTPLDEKQTKAIQQEHTIEEVKTLSAEKEKEKTVKEVLGQMLESIDSTEEAMQSKEAAKKAKLEQIKELGLDSKTADEVTSTVVDALFAMKEVHDDMKTDLQAINVSAEEVLPYDSSIKTKARKNKSNNKYLKAVINEYEESIKKNQEELDKAKREEREIKREIARNENSSTSKDDKENKPKNLQDTISKLEGEIHEDRKKKDAEITRISPEIGPVVDVNDKTKKLIDNLKKGYM